MAGLIIFGLASALPLVVATPLWLIISRAVAGVGAALVMPATLAIITAGFPEERRAHAVGIWAGFVGSGGIAGLLVSGLILSYASWTLIFVGFVGFAASSAVMVIAALTVASSREYERTRPDVRGAVLSIAAVGLVVFGVIEAPHRGWTDPIVLASLAGGVAAAAGFVAAELRTAAPMLDVRLFGNRAFGSGAAALLLQFLAVFGVFFVLIQYLQLVLGYSPFRSALALTPLGVAVLLLSVLVPRVSHRIGLRALTAAGLAGIGIALVWIGSLEEGLSYWQVIGPLLVAGVGLGLCTAPSTHAIVANTPADKQGVASAVNDATREIGAAIGVALAGSVLAAAYSQRIAPVASALPEPARGAVAGSLASAVQVADAAGPRGAELVTVARQAFLDGMQQASWTLAAVVLVGAIILLWWAPGRD